METSAMVDTPLTPSSSPVASATSEGPIVSSGAAATPRVARLTSWSVEDGWVCRTCKHMFGTNSVHASVEEVLRDHKQGKRHTGVSKLVQRRPLRAATMLCCDKGASIIIAPKHHLQHQATPKLATGGE